MGRLSKFQGCLIGGAAGDALGYAVEFSTYDEMVRRYGPRGIEEYKLDPASGLALISDDTQMTLFTANAILIGATRSHLRGIAGNAACYARHTYLDWLHTQDASFTDDPGDSWLLGIPELYRRRAPGNTCLDALYAGAKGTTGSPINNSKGCGGIMRVAPAGLYFKNPTVAAKQAAELAALTHGHPLGFIPAAVLAYAISCCVHGAEAVEPSEVELAALFREAVGVAGELYPAHPHALTAMAELVERAIGLAASDCPDNEGVAQLGEGWVAEETLAIALFACLRHPADFAAAIRCAVNHDGDSDSTGAVCGNIMGALLGMEGIPAEWHEHLELSSVILELARDLHDGCRMSEYGTTWDARWGAKYAQSCMGAVAINDHLRNTVRQIIE